jgi:hypothetical protein
MTRKIAAFIVVLICVMNLFAIATFASDGQTLDEIVSGSGSSESSSGSGSGGGNSSGTGDNRKDVQDDSSAIAGVYGSTDLSEPVEGLDGAKTAMVRAAATIVQIVSMFVVVGFAVTVALDICYIAVPFSRKWLCNGYSGQANNQTPQNGMNNAMGSMGSGYGVGGYGAGGYGYGGGSYGNSMANNMSQNMMAQQNMQGMNQTQMQAYKVQFISNAALDAVAMENVVDQQTGKATNPYAHYFTQKVIAILFIGVILVLNMTGSLMRISIMVGNALSNMADNANF